jgi:pimeloyl-ACP methyl ester carboxylesterase
MKEDHTPRDDVSSGSVSGDESQGDALTIQPQPGKPAGPALPAPLLTAKRWSSLHGKQRRGLVVALVVGLVVLTLGSSFLYLVMPRLTPAPAPVSSAFHASQCPFKPGLGIVEGQDVKCGYLVVPEDRTRPHSPTIRLAVAVFKSRASRSFPDPVLYLTGGPGDALLEEVGPHYLDYLPDYALDHDFILLDQRGTGYSQPSLACPEVLALHYRSLNERLSLDARAALEVQAARMCHNRLVSAGINLNAYNTLENAADVHDLVRALGYKQVNLYGISYGTRLALTVMRLYPADLRSVVLDSVYPPQENFFTSLPNSVQRVFNVLFNGCAAELACKQAYPHLPTAFYTLVADLDTTPIPFQTTDAQTGKSYTVLFTGDDLLLWLFHSLYRTYLIPRLPAVIFQVRNHDYTQLSQIYSEVIFRFSDTLSFGMNYSVQCSEDMAFTTPQDLAASVRILEPQLRPALLSYLQESYSICQLWGVKPAPLVQKESVTSAIPTLILAGEYDPVTPPANGMLAARTLSKSFSFLFPGTGHGVQYTNPPCADEIIFAFQEIPAEKPDSSCIDKIGEPLFE